MTTKRRNSLNVPEELVVEILSRLPATCVARLRCTSKRWNALIKDGTLAKKHSSNAPRQSLVIMVADFRVFLVSVDINRIYNSVVKVIGRFSLKDPLYNPFEEVDLYEVYPCDGLLLCSTMDYRLVVWNPCSGATKWIKPKVCGKCDYALGYDNKSSCYKILMMEWFANECRCNIYDFTSNSWRDIGVYTYWIIGDGNKRGVYAKGNNFWIAYTQHIPNHQNWLLRFDFSTERFQALYLPYYFNHFPPYGVVALSVVREEQLCLLVTHQNVDWVDFNVWVTTKIESSTGLISWNKFLTTKVGHRFSPSMSFLADEQNKVVVCRDNIDAPNNTLHIVSEDTYIQVDHHRGTESYIHSIFLSYVPTLVQIPQVM